MKTTVSRYDFERAFVDAGRKNQFSYEALGLLFAYLEEYEESTGEEIELDVVALCCEYYEDTLESIAANYCIDLEGMDDDEQIEAVREYLQDNTQLVGETATGFVYACF
jgi:predicted ArsR family transcriptional regulator